MRPRTTTAPGDVPELRLLRLREPVGATCVDQLRVASRGVLAQACVRAQIYLAGVTARDTPSPLDAASLRAQEATVLDRLIAAGISESRARAWIAGGGTRVDGHPVTDPAYPAESPARITMHSA